MPGIPDGNSGYITGWQYTYRYLQFLSLKNNIDRIRAEGRLMI